MVMLTWTPTLPLLWVCIASKRSRSLFERLVTREEGLARICKRSYVSVLRVYIDVKVPKVRWWLASQDLKCFNYKSVFFHRNLIYTALRRLK